MKLTITQGEYFGDPCLRVKAVIPKSIKAGIPKRRQKTWRIVLDSNLETAEAEMKAAAKAQAERWEQSILHPKPKDVYKQPTL